MKRMLSLFLLALPALSLAAPKAAQKVISARVLDTASIHRDYVEGDFDQAVDAIEAALRGGGPFTHADSVFIAKHLGVMYAAKYETREKGKKWMMILLEVEPSARIMDMYASDMIYMIFKNIQDEYDMNRARLKRAQAHVDGNARVNSPDTAKPVPGPKSGRSEPKEKSSHAWVPWTIGGVAVAGGILTYVLLSSDEGTKKKVNVVP